MSNPSLEYQSPGPLSIGNVISAAARIYRDHFVVYYKLALIATLWFIVPIYGWAKFMAISGLLSRLAYGEVIGKPESVTEARRHVNPRLWTFFGAGLLVFLIFFGWYFFFGITGVIAGIIIRNLSIMLFQNNTVLSWLVFSLFAILLFSIFIISLFWLNSRLYLVDLSIAIEDQSSSTKAIKRSFKLTQKFIFRIMLIGFIAFLIAIPISSGLQVFNFLIRSALVIIFPQDSPIFAVIYLPLSFILSLGLSAILVPFWQSIKAVLYYDLRSRREGIDIQLRDSI
ncbi:hypothetical protein [Crocosphaera sp. Alani8]|uniref:hypothetical protein n=1 Tax=Crocosphaera sp. Alani8 TaxID=3038952 RepID=UPI00313DC140